MGYPDLDGLFGPQMLDETMGYEASKFGDLDDHPNIPCGWESPSFVHRNMDRPATVQTYYAQVPSEAPTTAASRTPSPTIPTRQTKSAEWEERLPADLLDDL